MLHSFEVSFLLRTTGHKTAKEAHQHQDRSSPHVEPAGKDTKGALAAGGFSDVKVEKHILYAGQLAGAFSHVASRMIHDQSSNIRASTYAMPDYNTKTNKLNRRRFFQTGFAAVTGNPHRTVDKHDIIHAELLMPKMYTFFDHLFQHAQAPTSMHLACHNQ